MDYFWGILNEFVKEHSDLGRFSLPIIKQIIGVNKVCMVWSYICKSDYNMWTKKNGKYTKKC